MMRALRIAVCSAAAFCAAGLAIAADPPPENNYNCQSIYAVKAKETHYKLKAADIESCIMRGWDPPGKLDTSYPADYNWQPAGGTPSRSGSAASVQIGAKQPPAVPPGSSNNSTPTGSSGNISYFGNQPNQSGSQCFDLRGQRVCPRCSVTNGQNVCEVPVLDPATGQITYQPATGNEEERVLQPVNPVVGDIGGQLGAICLATNGKNLPCGGAMNLSNTEVSTVMNATHLVIAKQQNRDVRVYVRATGASAFTFLRQVRLAKDLCGVDEDKRTRPVNQFVFFNMTQPQVALRAIQPRKEAQDQDGAAYNPADDEKYILTSPGRLVNGNSGDCETFKKYPPNIPDFRIIPPQASGDVTMELPLNTDACKDRVLHLDLSSPSLVHQPMAAGSTVNVASIAEHDEKATLSTDTSILFFQPETIVRLGAPGQYTVRGAAVMELSDSTLLHMYGPTTFSGGQIPTFHLGGGGHIEDIEGNIAPGGRLPPNATFSPQLLPGKATPPYYLILDEKIYLPAGLTLLNERAGYLREPSNPPPPADGSTPPVVASACRP